MPDTCKDCGHPRCYGSAAQCRQCYLLRAAIRRQALRKQAIVKQAEAQKAKAGYRPAEWCAGIGICRATFYNLPLTQRPHSVMIGRARIITESPAQWLARMQAEQNDHA